MKNSILASVLLSALTAFPSANAQDESKGLPQEQLQRWVDAIKSRDASKIVQLYEDNAVLLSTFNGKPITNQEERLSYFEGLAKKPDLSVTVTEANYNQHGNIVTASGLYTFSFTQDGKKVEVPARFTFVFEKDVNRGWRIEDHHSSLVPQPAPASAQSR
jgi:hypothetical protein